LQPKKRKCGGKGDKGVLSNNDEKNKDKGAEKKEIDELGEGDDQEGIRLVDSMGMARCAGGGFFAKRRRRGGERRYRKEMSTSIGF